MTLVFSLVGKSLDSHRPASEDVLQEPPMWVAAEEVLAEGDEGREIGDNISRETVELRTEVGEKRLKEVVG